MPRPAIALEELPWFVSSIEGRACQMPVGGACSPSVVVVCMRSIVPAGRPLHSSGTTAVDQVRREDRSSVCDLGFDGPEGVGNDRVDEVGDLVQCLVGLGKE